MIETRKRTVVKAILYRGLVTAILSALTWIFTGNSGQTTFITLIYAVLATAGYYGHERLWNKVLWGMRAVPTVAGARN